MICDLVTRSWVLSFPLETPPSNSGFSARVAVIGVLLGDSFPPAGVEVAVISPSGRLFVGVIVATPWSFATASPITTPSLL